MPATIVGTSPGYDLAVLKVDKTGLPAVTLGDSDAVRVGDTAIAIGSPLAWRTPSPPASSPRSTVPSPPAVRARRPSSTPSKPTRRSNRATPAARWSTRPARSWASRLRHRDLGSSGSGEQSGSIGLGFAIPIGTASRIADEIIRTGSSTTPIVGVQLDTQFAGPGAKVAQVTADGPAAKAGLQAGDVVTKVDGTAIADSTAFIVSIRNAQPGDQVTLTVERGGSAQDVTVTLGSQQN